MKVDKPVGAGFQRPSHDHQNAIVVNVVGEKNASTRESNVGKLGIHRRVSSPGPDSRFNSDKVVFRGQFEPRVEYSREQDLRASSTRPVKIPREKCQGERWTIAMPASQTRRNSVLLTSACALNVERLSEAEGRDVRVGAPGYIGCLFGFLDGWIGGGGVPPAKPLRSYQCGKSPLGSLGGSARFSRDSSVSLYSIPGQ